MCIVTYRSIIKLDADLPDFNMVNAFLLGRDLRRLARDDEVEYLGKFVEQFVASEEEGLNEQNFPMRIFRSEIRALQTGFQGSVMQPKYHVSASNIGAGIDKAKAKTVMIGLSTVGDGAHMSVNVRSGFRNRSWKLPTSASNFKHLTRK
jgi:hypothetical protein